MGLKAKITKCPGFARHYFLNQHGSVVNLNYYTFPPIQNYFKIIFKIFGVIIAMVVILLQNDFVISKYTY